MPTASAISVSVICRMPRSAPSTRAASKIADSRSCLAAALRARWKSGTVTRPS